VSVASHACGVFAWSGQGDARLIERLWLWRHHPIAEAMWGPPTAPSRPAEPFLLDPRRIIGRDASVRMDLNAMRFKHEEYLVTGLTAANGSGRPLELYAGLIAPGPLIAFIPARERMATPVPGARREWFRALMTLSPGERVDEPTLLRALVHYHVDPGSSFIAFAALVEPGSAPWRMVAADVAPVVVE
jgi:hypothetical protein